MADTHLHQAPIMSSSDVVWSAYSLASSNSSRALLFESRGLLFALLAEAVSEVIDVPVTQSVPGSASWFAGVAVYRGRPVPVIDAALYLAPDLPPPSPDLQSLEFNRAIAVRVASSNYLIAANRILNLSNLPQETHPQEMSGMPRYAEHRAIRKVCNFENRLLAVIDLPELLRCTKLLRECAVC